MTPRRIIRWKSLWLGVMTVVFFCWLWMRSMSQLDIVAILSSTALEAVVCRSNGGVLSVHATGAHRSFLPKDPYITRSSWPYVAERQGFPEPASFEALAPGEWKASVAYWVLLLLFLLPWLGFLCWRAWRIKRHAKDVAMPPGR